MEQSPFLTSIQAYMYQRRGARRTIKAYLAWIHCYTNSHKKQHPSTMDDAHVEAFLNHLVLERWAAPQTHALALNALNFLYKNIVHPLCLRLSFIRSRPPRKLPVLLILEEMVTLMDKIAAERSLIIAR